MSEQPRSSHWPLEAASVATDPLSPAHQAALSLSEAAAVVWADGRVRAANAAFLSLPGLLAASHHDPDQPAELLSALVLRALHGEEDSFVAGEGASGGRRTVSLPRSEGERVYELLPLPTESSEAGGSFVLLVFDRSLDVGIRAALTLSRARYKDMVEISTDYAWETDRQGAFSFVAPQGLFGYDARDLIGKPVAEVVSVLPPAGPVLPFVTLTPLHRGELWVQTVEGKAVCLEISATPLFDHAGNWAGARGICRDVSDDRRLQSEAAEARARERVLNRIVRLFQREVSPDNMLKAAASAITHGLSATGCQIFGTTTPLVRSLTRPSFVEEASFGRGGSMDACTLLFARLFEVGDYVLFEQFETRQVIACLTRFGDHVNGAVLVWREDGRASFTPVEHRLLFSLGGQVGIALEQLHNHRVLVDISRTDGLTGLLNRRAFYEDMQRRIRRLGYSGLCGALMYVDLDNFKQVNDRRGHDVGDEVLRRVGEILKTNTRATDIVARLGGDEFAIWLEAADATVASKRASVFLSAAGVLRRFSGTPEAPLMLSIGIAIFDPAYGEDMNQFISRADSAMYAVKRRGKGSYGIAPPPAKSGHSGQGA